MHEITSLADSPGTNDHPTAATSATGARNHSDGMPSTKSACNGLGCTVNAPEADFGAGQKNGTSPPGRRIRWALPVLRQVLVPVTPCLKL